jgi:Mg/Co/Ni transporter MgtE
MNWIAKIVAVNLVLWGFVFLCVVSVWCFAQASSDEVAHRMTPIVVCVGLLAALLAAAIVTVLFWFIFKRAGAHPALSILVIVPLVNLVTLY